MLSSFLYLLGLIVALFWLIQLIDLFLRDLRDFESHTHKLIWFWFLSPARSSAPSGTTSGNATSWPSKPNGSDANVYAWVCMAERCSMKQRVFNLKQGLRRLAPLTPLIALAIAVCLTIGDNRAIFPHRQSKSVGRSGSR